MQLVALGQNSGEANNASFGGIGTSQQALDLCLVADFALVQADHVRASKCAARVIESMTLSLFQEFEIDYHRQPIKLIKMMMYESNFGNFIQRQCKKQDAKENGP